MASTESPILQHALLLEEAEQIARVGTFEWHLATDERIWTPGLWRIFGIEPASGRPDVEEFLSCVHPDDREAQRRLLKLALLENPKSWQSTYRVSRPDGRVAHVRTRAACSRRRTKWS